MRLKEKVKQILNKKRYSKSHKHICSIIKERPLDINIELTNTCPMSCVFCCNRKIKRDLRNMNMDLFEKICKEYIEMGGGSIGLSSMQSDVFSDPLLLERLCFLKPVKGKMYIYTTNPLISIAKYTDSELKLILEVFDYIQVSIEGTNRKDYLEMCGVDAFDQLMINLYRVKAMIKKYNIKTRIELHFRTYSLEKLKKDDTYVKLMEDFSEGGAIDTYFDWFGSIKQSDLPVGAKLISKINIKETEDCSAALSTLAINSEGCVIGCGCIDWNSKYIIGNCNSDTLYKIWQSAPAKEFRHGFSLKNIPDICRKCGLYTSNVEAYSQKKLKDYKVTDGVYYAEK